MNDIQNYYEVFTECWKYFKKYYEHFDGAQSIADIQKFEEHFKTKKYGPRIYDFAMRFIRRCEEEAKKKENELLTEDSLSEFAMDLIKIFWKEAGEIHEVRCSVSD